MGGSGVEGEAGEGFSEDGGAAVAEDSFSCGVPFEDFAFVVDGDDGIGGGVEDGCFTGLGFDLGLFGEALVGDVIDDDSDALVGEGEGADGEVASGDAFVFVGDAAEVFGLAGVDDFGEALGYGGFGEFGEEFEDGFADEGVDREAEDSGGGGVSGDELEASGLWGVELPDEDTEVDVAGDIVVASGFFFGLAAA